MGCFIGGRYRPVGSDESVDEEYRSRQKQTPYVQRFGNAVGR